MKRSGANTAALPRRLACAIAAAGLLAGITSISPALAAPPDPIASMVKPPAAAASRSVPGAAGPVNPANPDNMPVKRPPARTGDPIQLNSPASDAIAK